MKKLKPGTFVYLGDDKIVYEIRSAAKWRDPETILEYSVMLPLGGGFKTVSADAITFPPQDEIDKVIAAQRADLAKKGTQRTSHISKNIRHFWNEKGSGWMAMSYPPFAKSRNSKGKLAAMNARKLLITSPN